MNRGEFERHLRANGCRLDHEGGRHSIWTNRESGATSAVPRHSPINRNTVRRICDDLGIPRHPSL